MEVLKTVEQVRVDVLELQADVDRLTVLQDKLIGEIDAASAEVKRGSVPGSVKLNGLACEKSEVDRQLLVASRELKAAQAELRRVVEQEDRQQFQRCIREAREARALFVENYRQCALLLGRYCRSTEQATRLYNQIIAGKLLVDPRDKNAVIELAEPPNPLQEWRGVTGVKGFGYDLRILIPAMEPEIKAHPIASPLRAAMPLTKKRVRRISARSKSNFLLVSVMAMFRQPSSLSAPSSAATFYSLTVRRPPNIISLARSGTFGIGKEARP